jgi:hypothetical protein
MVQAVSNISVSFNGTFVHQTLSEDAKANSKNGLYWCDYTGGRVGCAERELLDFRFYENNRLLFVLDRAPGADLYISNTGVVAFMDMTYHFRNKVKVHFYNREGEHLFSKTFKGANGFAFSPDGNRFGAKAGDQLHVVTISTGETEIYPWGYEFDFSEDGRLVAIAKEGWIRVYSNGDLLQQIKTGFLLPRKVRISSDHNLIAVIDKRNFNVYSLSDGHLIFTDRLTGALSFRDLLLSSGEIKAGVHYRHDGVSKGIIKTFSPDGDVITTRESESRTFKTFSDIEVAERSISRYDPIPWPFEPFDEMHTVWNTYEQLTWFSGLPVDSTYLHQGLDIIVPENEPTYAVEPGFVKYVGSGGYLYGEIDVSPEWVSGWSDGWVYMHVIEQTIQFDVGDTVQLHDYLGDIVPWVGGISGHLHFVEISDSGLVWSSPENVTLNFNPLRALVSDTDTIPPVIGDVFADSKFGFCEDETSNYLDPDSLNGDIDIIVKVIDYIGDSEWQQPAFETYYWVKSLPAGEIVFPRTMGHRLNHRHESQFLDHLVSCARVIYKWDSILLHPDLYVEERDFYHVVTNSDGDSLIDHSEKDLAFNTEDYPDGEYRIFVEATDEYGNSCVDSMDVRFIPPTGISDNKPPSMDLPRSWALSQNYPNPFNPSTTILFDISGTAGAMQPVNLTVYDIRGRRVRTLVDSDLDPGTHKIHWNGRDERGQPIASGIYLYTLRAGNETFTRKMTVLK